MNSVRNPRRSVVLMVETPQGRSEAVSVHKDEKFYQIKMKLQTLTGIPTDQQQLMLRSSLQILPNYSSVEQYETLVDSYPRTLVILRRGIPESSYSYSEKTDAAAGSLRLPGKPLYSAAFVEAEPFATSNSEPAGAFQQEELLVTRTATEFLTMPPNDLFQIEDVLAIILSYVDRDTKLDSCRFVNKRFKSLLTGPAPFRSQIPQLGDTGCFGCFEAKVVPFSAREEHVVMAGPATTCDLVKFYIALILALISFLALIIGVSITKNGLWCLCGVLFGPCFFVLCKMGFGWRRFVVNYNTRMVKKSIPMCMFLGIGWCCCLEKMPLSQFRNFSVSVETYYSQETDSNGRVRNVRHHSYTSHVGGWSWSGKGDMDACRALSYQIFDPNTGFHPPENPVWKMV